MARGLNWKVYDADREYIAATRHPQDAAALLVFQPGAVVKRDNRIVYRRPTTYSADEEAIYRASREMIATARHQHLERFIDRHGEAKARETFGDAVVAEVAS